MRLSFLATFAPWNIISILYSLTTRVKNVEGGKTGVNCGILLRNQNSNACFPPSRNVTYVRMARYVTVRYGTLRKNNVT